ncbi:hypothetical protein, partial [Nonomuraea cavernae]|uniref:hypothetical protein n=1 Tax=Nonomuraea cavernae TaxID=2045107 RepID=UPI0033CFE44D
QIVGEAQGHSQTIADTPTVTLANDLKIYRCSTGGLRLRSNQGIEWRQQEPAFATGRSLSMGKVEDRLYDFFDRHVWVAFLLAALMMGAAPLILLEQVFDQPRLWPRVMVGAVIGMSVVAIPAALALVRKIRRAAFGVLALVVAAALGATAGIGGFERWHDPVPLGNAGQAELAGLLAATVVLGAVAVLVMGAYVVLGQTRGRRHRGRVEELAPNSYVAICECGWQGEGRRDSSAAFVDAGNHANKVDLSIRKHDFSPIDKAASIEGPPAARPRSADEVSTAGAACGGRPGVPPPFGTGAHAARPDGER